LVAPFGFRHGLEIGIFQWWFWPGVQRGRDVIPLATLLHPLRLTAIVMRKMRI
jgi:hypothetical protein